MNTDLVKVTSSEHWLTMMMCSECEKLPDDSLMYKCDMGHYLCKNCFSALKERGNRLRPKCGRCHSLDLTKHAISADFLRKLRIKPGIGRSRRYDHGYWPLSIETYDKSVPKKDITIEKLFQLNRFQIKQLFGLRNKHRPALTWRHKFERGDTVVDLRRKCPSNSVIVKNSFSVCSLSRKPIICPHGHCRKMVTISSFAQHFKYDHPDITCHRCARGEELYLHHDVKDIEYNFTQCAAIVDVADVDQIDTFWLMITGSPEQEEYKAYVIYWLLTNATSHPNCAIELSSHLQNISYSTFCPVARIYDNFQPLEIAQTLYCLHIPYSSMCNILSEGPALHLRITVY
ncbi:hypothetical protein RI129_006634 [Pyrocoelia pectoralis]|uniref:DUF4729 domain-containing protein n=1 Tax=Pyrocoelia pectoralis TaxID=417401 RepID=A0AAN7VKD0_9COLE